MKIHFVYSYFKGNTRSGAITVTYPPLGISYLASYIRKYSKFPLEIKITDGLVKKKEATISEIINFGADILCVSALTPTITGAYELINIVKDKMPDVFVVMGGVHAASLPEDVFTKSKTDVVVTGEGELTLLEIIEKLNRKESIYNVDGIAYKHNGKLVINKSKEFIQDLDTIPFPDYSFYDDLKIYKGWLFVKQKPDIGLFSGRGCPYSCVYCANKIWKSSRPFLRLRSPKNIVDEYEKLKKEFKIGEVFDLIDEFNVNIPWALAVCDELINRKLNVVWKVQLRADRMTDELAKKMAESGCWYVHIGAETGNQKTLDGIGKNVKLESVEESCKILKKYGFKIMTLFMIFNIWEKDGKLEYEGVKESLNTLNFAKRLSDKKLTDYISWGPTTPYPGSRLFEIAKKYDLILPGKLENWHEWNNTWDITAKLPDVTMQDYIKVKNKGVYLQILTTIRSGYTNLSEITTFIARGLRLLWNIISAKGVRSCRKP